MSLLFKIGALVNLVPPLIDYIRDSLYSTKRELHGYKNCLSFGTARQRPKSK